LGEKEPFAKIGFLVVKNVFVFDTIYHKKGIWIRMRTGPDKLARLGTIFVPRTDTA